MRYRIIYKYSVIFDTMRYVAQYKTWVFGPWLTISSSKDVQGAQDAIDLMTKRYQPEEVVWESPR